MKGQSAFFKAVCALGRPRGTAIDAAIVVQYGRSNLTGQLGVSLAVFRRRRWMDRLGSSEMN